MTEVVLLSWDGWAPVLGIPPVSHGWCGLAGFQLGGCCRGSAMACEGGRRRVEGPVRQHEKLHAMAHDPLIEVASAVLTAALGIR